MTYFQLNGLLISTSTRAGLMCTRRVRCAPGDETMLRLLGKHAPYNGGDYVVALPPGSFYSKRVTQSDEPVMPGESVPYLHRPVCPLPKAQWRWALSAPSSSERLCFGFLKPPANFSRCASLNSTALCDSPRCDVTVYRSRPSVTSRYLELSTQHNQRM